MKKVYRFTSFKDTYLDYRCISNGFDIDNMDCMRRYARCIISKNSVEIDNNFFYIKFADQPYYIRTIGDMNSIVSNKLVDYYSDDL